MIEAPWHEGDVIRKLRLLAGWGLEELAVVAGLKVSTINLLELGVTQEAKRPTLTKLATAFGLTFAELLDQVPKAPIKTNVPIVVRKRSRTGRDEGEGQPAKQSAPRGRRMAAR